MSGISDMDDDLLRRARGLPHDIAPARDLWPGIAAALAPPRRRFDAVRLALAATVLIGVTAVATLWLAGAGFPGERIELARAEPALTSRFGPRFVMGTEFAETRNTLLQSVHARLEQLSPETQTELVQSLAAIEQALDDLNEALDGEPESALLLHLLLDTYTAELRLLGDIDSYTRTLTERIETQRIEV